MYVSKAHIFKSHSKAEKTSISTNIKDVVNGFFRNSEECT